MRWRKRGLELGCFFGCLLLLLGLLATVAPLIQNEQLQRIIESLSMKEVNGAVNAVNGFLLGCMRFSYGLMLMGAALLAFSLLMQRKLPPDSAPAVPTAARPRAENPRAAQEKAQRAASVAAAPASPPVARRASRPETPFVPRNPPPTGNPIEKYLPRPIVSAEEAPDEDELAAWRRPKEKPSDPLEALRTEAQRARELAEAQSAALQKTSANAYQRPEATSIPAIAEATVKPMLTEAALDKEESKAPERQPDLKPTAAPRSMEQLFKPVGAPREETPPVTTLWTTLPLTTASPSGEKAEEQPKQTSQPAAAKPKIVTTMHHPRKPASTEDAPALKQAPRIVSTMGKKKE